MSTGVLFPGQGTQVPLMGVPWRQHRCWDIVGEAEEALGTSLESLICSPDPRVLSRTSDAQLAVFMSSMLAWEAIRDRIDTPVAFAGHSLGQITALVAAGALTLTQGLRLARHRATATQHAADRRPGRMAALLGATPEQAARIARSCSPATGSVDAGEGFVGPDSASGDWVDPEAMDQSCWVANDNAPGQVVIGGTPEGIDAATVRAKAAGIRRVIPLKVAAAFHTPLMAEAALDFAAALASTPFVTAEVPVVCNTDARALTHADWSTRLAQHLVSPVRWRESVDTLRGLGADTFYEMGPGGVLGGLVRRCYPDAQITTVAAPDDLPPPVLVGAPLNAAFPDVGFSTDGALMVAIPKRTV
ncbi:MAG: ACP S-malonyltransferase [Acidimicrobiales bacterium]